MVSMRGAHLKKLESRVDALISKRVIVGGCLVDAEGNAYDPSKHGKYPLDRGFEFYDPEEVDPVSTEPLGSGGRQVVCYAGWQPAHNYRTHDRATLIDMLRKGIQENKDNLLLEPETRDPILKHFNHIEDDKIIVLKPCPAKLKAYVRTLCDDAKNWVEDVNAWEMTKGIHKVQMADVPDCTEYAACVGEFMEDMLREGRLILGSYNAVADGGEQNQIINDLERKCTNYTTRFDSLTEIWGDEWYDDLRYFTRRLKASVDEKAVAHWKPLPFYDKNKSLTQSVRDLNEAYMIHFEDMREMVIVLKGRDLLQEFVAKFNTAFKAKSECRLALNLRKRFEQLQNIVYGFQFWEQFLGRKKEQKQMMALQIAREHFRKYRKDYWSNGPNYYDRSSGLYKVFEKAWG